MLRFPIVPCFSTHGWCHQLSLSYHCKELGAGLLSWKWSLTRESNTTTKKPCTCFHIDEGENPVSIQLFGSDEDSLARAAEFIQENTKTDIVGYQHGLSCQQNRGRTKLALCGSRILDKIYSIINKVQSVLDIPLTVKMRTGWAGPISGSRKCPGC